MILRHAFLGRTFSGGTPVTDSVGSLQRSNRYICLWVTQAGFTMGPTRTFGVRLNGLPGFGKRPAALPRYQATPCNTYGAPN